MAPSPACVLSLGICLLFNEPGIDTDPGRSNLMRRLEYCTADLEAVRCVMSSSLRMDLDKLNFGEPVN